MQKPEIISKFNFTNRTVYGLCIAFFFSLTAYLIFQYNPKDFRTISNLFFALGSFIVGFWILYEIYCAPKLVLFSNRIEIERLFGLKKEIYQRKEIKSWVLKEKPSKYGSYHNLYLVLDSSKKIKLCSYDYDNFYAFQYSLTHDLAIDNELDRKLEIRENVKYSLLFLFLGLIFFFL